MNARYAEQLGRRAFADGKFCSPLVDPEIAAELEGTKIGEKTDIMRAWYSGWQAANLAAPVPGVTDTPEWLANR